MARNKFKAAINHIKSTDVDEKIQRLNEAPTNSLSGVYDLSPRGQRYGEKNPPKTFYANLDGSWPPGVPGTPGERKYVRPIGYWEEGPGATPSVQHDEIVELDFSYDTQTDDPRNTKTLIDETSGRVKTDLPPNSRSFILGPLVDLFHYNHGYDNRTFVGYIQKDTREFVLLGSIFGTWGNDNNGVPIRADGYEGGTTVWDGTNGTFTAHNPNFTFEMLQWHHERLKEGKSVKNVSFFHSGGVPIIQGGGGTGQPTGTVQGNVSGTPGPGDAGNNGDADQTHGSGGNPDIGTPQNDPIMGNPHDEPRPYEPLEDQGAPHDIYGDLLLLGLSAAVAFALAKAIAAGSAAALSQAKRLAQGAKNWWNKGRNTRIPNENQASWRDLFRDDLAQRGQSDAAFQAGKAPRGIGRPDQAFNPFRPASKGGPGSGPTPMVRQVFERPIRWLLGQSYEMNGNFIVEEVSDDIIDALESALKETETLGEFMTVLDGVIAKIEQRESELKKQTSEEVSPRKKLIQEIKKPYTVKEVKQEKLKGYRPKTYGKLHAQYDKLMQKAENPATFKPMDETTWTKQDKYYNTRLSQERKNEVLDHLGTGDHFWEILTETGRKRDEDQLKEKYGDFTLVRKEQLAGDTLLFLVDENGKKETILQSEYSDRIARQIEEPLWEQETLNAPNDPLIKRVRNKLATQIDYPDKPSRMGYPDGPTPQQINGWHPEYGKRAAYYNALDPQSADSMPATGDPETDQKVFSQKTPLKPVKQVYKKKGKPNS